MVCAVPPQKACLHTCIVHNLQSCGVSNPAPFESGWMLCSLRKKKKEEEDAAGFVTRLGIK